MIDDKAPANRRFLRKMRGGDTGRGRVEHRKISELRVAQKSEN